MCIQLVQEQCLYVQQIMHGSYNIKVLQRIFEKRDGAHGMDLCGSGYGQVTGCCECGNEPPGSIKCGEFPDYVRTFT